MYYGKESVTARACSNSSQERAKADHSFDTSLPVCMRPFRLQIKILHDFIKFYINNSLFLGVKPPSALVIRFTTGVL